MASIVKGYFELPVKVDNDANVAVVAEAKLGAGAGYESVYYLTVSTGVGGGFVINGKVFQGANGMPERLAI
ncbi:ROK family protein [Rossellomorea arthrocnemi]|uniref:ROK family protein n=1 Tax=Rossellomorea arthrocnemi TaxID=2769542 RepID=UPI0022AB0EF3|nr:ROK family protein [Rossellomorea arthrocnemi]